MTMNSLAAVNDRPARLDEAPEPLDDLFYIGRRNTARRFPQYWVFCDGRIRGSIRRSRLVLFGYVACPLGDTRGRFFLRSRRAAAWLAGFLR